MNFIEDIARGTGPLFIIGSCKNAGKTTLLNYLNAELYQRIPAPISLLTIGRDGEAEDAIWHHPKPPVSLFPGNFFVTIEPELRRLGAAAEQVDRLPFYTALGPMVIGRARWEAQVEIIGPDTNSELWTALEKLRRLGSPLQLVDGAYERRTQVAISDNARLALVVSADIAPSAQRAGEWLAFQRELFGLPKAPKDLIPHAPLPQGLSWLKNGQWQEKPAGAEAICCIGPLVESAIEPFLEVFRGLRLVVEDATKIFLDLAAWRKMLRRVSGVYVMRPLRLILAASNPRGQLRQFPADAMLKALVDAAAGLPVIDVLKVKL